MHLPIKLSPFILAIAGILPESAAATPPAERSAESVGGGWCSAPSLGSTGGRSLGLQGRGRGVLKTLGNRDFDPGANLAQGPTVAIRVHAEALTPDASLWRSLDRMHGSTLHQGVAWVLVLDGFGGDREGLAQARGWARQRRIPFPILQRLPGAMGPLEGPENSITVHEKGGRQLATFPLRGSLTETLLRTSLGELSGVGPLEPDAEPRTPRESPATQRPKRTEPKPPAEPKADAPQPKQPRAEQELLSSLQASAVTAMGQAAQGSSLADAVRGRRSVLVVLASFDRDAVRVAGEIQRLSQGAPVSGKTPRVHWLLLEPGATETERQQSAARFRQNSGVQGPMWVAPASSIRKLPAPRRLPQALVLDSSGKLTGKCGPGASLIPTLQEVLSGAQVPKK